MTLRSFLYKYGQEIMIVVSILIVGGFACSAIYSTVNKNVQEQIQWIVK